MARRQGGGHEGASEVKVVTGAAGFIGSHLVDTLLARGEKILAIDCLTDVYPTRLKRSNLQTIDRPQLTFLEQDVRSAKLAEIFDGAEAVYHLAAVPGVRASWSGGFRDYVEHNILGTQRVLEGAIAARVPRVVYASSSSVYGDHDRFPSSEKDLPQPRSPYGVTKLSAEQLCVLYAKVHGIHTVSLRYFSVYGPRQRPDMGIHRICEAAVGRGIFTLFGDGTQVRDLTYVTDVVEATIRAAEEDVEAGSVFNVAGGSRIPMRDLLALIGELNGHPVPVTVGPAQPGDVQRTGGATDQARTQLRWKPEVALRDGLSSQIAWHRSWS